jgi:hypothetical protein
VQLVARSPLFGEGQQVSDAQRPVPELFRQLLKEQKNLTVFFELAEVRELELTRFGTGVNFGRELGPIILTGVKAGD